MANYIQVSKVKKIAKEHGRRMGKDFLTLLDEFVAEKVKQACKVHNGGKQTLDASVAGWVGIKPKL